MSREAMQMALDAITDWGVSRRKVAETVEALRAALAQPEPEPVGWMYSATGTLFDTCPQDAEDGEFLPLYIAPPQCKPLTDEQIEGVFFDMGQYAKVDLKAFAREIEAAHGIG